MLPKFPGRAPFVAACLLLVLFALGHLGGVVQGVLAAHADPRLAAQFQSQREYTFTLAGVESSLWNLRQYFSMAFSLLLIFATVLAVLAVRFSRDPFGAARAVSWLALAAVGGLLALGLVFRVVQGVVTCSLLAIFFTACLIRLRRVPKPVAIP